MKKIYSIAISLVLTLVVNVASAQWTQTPNILSTPNNVNVGLSGFDSHKLSVYRTMQIASATGAGSDIGSLDFLLNGGWKLPTYYGSGFSLQYDPSNSTFNIFQRVNPSGGTGSVANVFNISNSGSINLGLPQSVGSHKLSVYRSMQLAAQSSTEGADLTSLDFLLNGGYKLSTYYGSGFSLQYDPNSSSFNILQRVNPSGGGGNVSTVFKINNLGNVGIGTTTPGFGLHVEKDNGNGWAFLARANSSYAGLLIGSQSANYIKIAGIDNTLGLFKDIAINPSGGNVGIGTTTPSQTLEVAGRVYANGDQFKSSVTSGSWVSGGFLSATGVVATNGDFAIYGETTPATRLVIKETTGNVGIGTTSPSSRLVVKGNGSLSEPVVSFDNVGSKIFMVPKLNVNGFSDLAKVGDAGIFWNDGLQTANGFPSNLSGGFVIAPYSWSGGIRIAANGNVGIGTKDPGLYKLAVEGKIGAREIKVTNAAWADYVFDKKYALMPLSALETFINSNKHLPNIPSAQEVETNGGVDLGEMQVKHLEKTEELYLYIIELNKRIVALEKQLPQNKK